MADPKASVIDPYLGLGLGGGGLRLTVGAQMGESVEFVEGQSFRNNNTANRQGYGASDPT